MIYANEAWPVKIRQSTYGVGGQEFEEIAVFPQRALYTFPASCVYRTRSYAKA